MAIGPKEAQRRALREMKFAQREKPIAKPKADRIVEARIAVNNGVNNAGKPSAKRQAKWREANPELNRQRARAGMRKKRAAEKHP